MTKAEYRTIYKNKRIALSSDECLFLDACIYNQLITMDLFGVNFIHFYISIGKFNEPDTLKYVSYLKENHPNISIVVSKTDFQNFEMIHYLWDDNLMLEENKWGILEPIDGIVIREDQLDLVIVPLLVADCEGNRVGYGKGFYDRFLSKCSPNVRKVGISYFDPVQNIDDVGDWDISLNVLVTPNQIFSFNK